MKNETAIVTGSTSGIGKKIAELFLREGCKVAICSRNEVNVKKTVEEFKEKFGDLVIGVACDVSKPTDLKNLVEKTLSAFGSIRILIANAGTSLIYGPFSYIPIEKVDSIARGTIDSNLIGMMNSVAAVFPQMQKQGYGRIVTLSGGGADRPIEHMTIYSASKGGVVAFTKCLALELKNQEEVDIKINYFQPGMINTNLSGTATLITEWKDQESFDEQYDLLKEYVFTDIEESCLKVLPLALPSCKKNGKGFRGFSLKKLIGGFRKIKKVMKEKGWDK